LGLKKKLDKEEIMKKLSRVSRAKEVKKRLTEAIASEATAKVGVMDQETNLKILEELIGGYQFDTD
jgi:TnpA family transposase